MRKKLLDIGIEAKKRFTTFSKGSVETILNIPWIKDLCLEGKRILSKHYRKLSRRGSKNEIIPIMYERFKSVLDLKEEIDKKYPEHLCFKFDFLCNNLEYTPIEFSRIIEHFINNYRNEFHLGSLITYFYVIDQDDNGYWHMHVYFFIKSDFLKKKNKEEDYLDYERLLMAYHAYFTGILVRLGMLNDIRINISNRLPEKYKYEKLVVYSKGDNIFSVNSDIYWISYGCKRSDGTDYYIKNDGSVRLFGKGKVR